MLRSLVGSEMCIRDRLQAFESGDHGCSRFAIIIHGLTEGLLGCPWVESLGAAMEPGWALVQPLVSSSYTGWGTGTVERDAAEIEALISHLAEHRGAQSVALIGHSTGCQDAVQLMQTGAGSVRSLVRAVVLQAPVSDREALSLDDNHELMLERLETAESMVATGMGRELVGELYGTAVSAERFASLHSKHGAEDMFSSDLSDEELAGRLGNMCTAGQRALKGTAEHPGLVTMVVFSMADEFVPDWVDKADHLTRLVRAMDSVVGSGEVKPVQLVGANHNLSEPCGAAAEFVTQVVKLLNQVP
eukprot:TRINITY_DN23797_c0_g1_i1.p1 TRINITY_DN23797_c0_g1~~TRINITY_DN23797_c0_g1_i1.p1  ORF type:complete len:338 (+),score=87.42 TRINITY_DN23797_c0_g1_i1:107-1015(+)